MITFILTLVFASLIFQNFRQPEISIGRKHGMLT